MSPFLPCPAPCPDVFRSTLSQLSEITLSDPVRTLSDANNSINSLSLSHSPAIGTMRGRQEGAVSGGRSGLLKRLLKRGTGLLETHPFRTHTECRDCFLTSQTALVVPVGVSPGNRTLTRSAKPQAYNDVGLSGLSPARSTGRLGGKKPYSPSHT